MDKISNLLPKMQSIVEHAKQKVEEARLRGEHFNIFNVLGLSTNETRTHSAFLAELLNPKGDHGCGNLFLTAFFSQLNFNFDSNGASVAIEKFIGYKDNNATEGGRIDILINCTNGIVIIENKIYAGDQENQLLRYSNYAKQQKKPAEILYLTLDGHEASEDSTQNEVEYQCISYKEDILKWLEKCAYIALKKPLVRETINQYINLVKQLTYQDMDNKEQNAMFAEMAKYPEAVAQMFHVGHTAYTKYAYYNFVKPKFEAFAEEYGLIYNDDSLFNSKERGFSFYKKEWENSAIYVWCDNDSKGFFCGISHNGKAESFQEFCKSISKLDVFNEKNNHYPLGWKWINVEIYKKWYTYTTRDMINGKYNEYFQNLVLEILKELDAKKITLP